MRRCPRCLIEFDDASKICRFCGGILDKVVEEKSPRAEPVLAAVTSAGSTAGKGWNCRKCGAIVPGPFALCWNCSEEDQEEGDAQLARRPQEPVAGTPQPVDTAAVARPLSCAACGSAKIIPDVLVRDEGQGSRGQLRVVVYGVPDALVFKDRLYGLLTANVCGECGHVQLQVANPRELYEHYLESKQ